MDNVSSEQRSRIMSRVKSKDTEPEMRLRSALWSEGFRYRLHYDLPGKPDLVFISARTAVFVDGCFWHGCPEHGSTPKSNSTYWEEKLEGNKERDRRVDAKLEERGWRVLRFWEHEINTNVDAVVCRIARLLREGPPSA